MERAAERVMARERLRQTEREAGGDRVRVRELRERRRGGGGDRYANRNNDQGPAENVSTSKVAP